MRRALAVTCFVVAATAFAPRIVAAQPTTASHVDVLLGTHAILHVADMVTTSYDLTRGRALGAREANPLLTVFGSNPVSIAAASSIISSAQAVMIKRVEPRHPKLATVWAASLVALEVWATINNINRMGEIQRGHW